MRKPSEPIAGSRTGLYGPVQRRERRDTHRARLPRPAVDLSAGTCAGLAPEVAARYFGAGRFDTFELATARTMCAGCPVLVECMADAIATPVPLRQRTGVVRAGVTAWDLAALRAEAERERTPVRRIAEREVSRMLPPLRGAYGSPRLRAGQFTSPTPLA